MFYLVLINGLVDSFNPCAIGVLILYVALILTLQAYRKTLIIFGLFYILATFATYFLIGLGILKVVHLFGIHNFFGWVAAILVIFLGLYQLKEYFLPSFRIPILSTILSRCRIPKYGREVTILSALVLGFLVAICEFPCSGGIYLATVALLSVKTTFWQGIWYLVLYNLMFILPLVVIFFAASNKYFFDILKKVQISSVQIIKLIMGIAMLISGILLLIWLI